MHNCYSTSRWQQSSKLSDPNWLELHCVACFLLLLKMWLSCLSPIYWFIQVSCWVSLLIYKHDLATNQNRKTTYSVWRPKVLDLFGKECIFKFFFWRKNRKKRQCGWSLNLNTVYLKHIWHSLFWQISLIYLSCRHKSPCGLVRCNNNSEMPCVFCNKTLLKYYKAKGSSLCYQTGNVTEKQKQVTCQLVRCISIN